MPRVIVVATGRKTRGGITSVIKAHEKGEQWKRFRCHWIQTHRDGGALVKLLNLAIALLSYVIALPFSDIVHIHTSGHHSALRKSIFMVLSRLFRKKTIVHYHAFSGDALKDKRYQGRYHCLFDKADRVLVLSETWKQIVNDIYHLGDKVLVLYNPCTAEVSDAAYRKQKHILYAGTIGQRKGYADLITAFARIAQNYPEWKLVFAGNGEIERGQALAFELGIAQQVVFAGWVRGDEKDRLFKEASVFCLPSYAEGFPMAVLDAWAYGLPVITTPVGGIPDVAKDGENMLLFNPGDIETLARQLKRMMSDDDLRSRICAASRDFARNQFNLETINRQLGDLYEEFNAH